MAIAHSRSLRPTLVLAFGCIGFSAAHALTIIPTFASNINSDANSVQIKATINQAIATYNAKFTDSVTVNITFQKGGGLGSSSSSFVTVSYTNLRNALLADASTSDDATAVSHLPNQATEPMTGGSTVSLTTANARALGLSGSASVDSTITLNTDICNLNHSVVTDPGKYDLYAVTCHEMDEALGTISGVGGSPWVADLYRYNGSGARSFTTSTSVHAYFSIDTTTNIVEYNQFGRTGGDWGDWIHHSPNPQVQDWSGTAGAIIDPGASEFTLLDAVGYNVAPVPEPATMAVLGIGALALIRRRRR